MSDFKGLYDIRDGNNNDKSFILATFLRGLYYGDSWFSLIPKHIFMDNYKHIAQLLVNNPNTVIKVACLKEDPNVILGYSLLSGDLHTMHFVFVKKAWRMKGIARSLVPSNLGCVTHLTTVGKDLLKKHSVIIFDPFRI